MKNLLADRKIKENATAQIAHLVFADTQKPTRKNQKSYFFANARMKISILQN